MYTAEIHFKLKRGASRQDAESAMSHLLVAFLDDGNVADRTVRVAVARGGYKVVVGMPERYALGSRWYSARARSEMRAMAKAGVELGAIRVLGRDPASQAVCVCNGSSAFIMVLRDLPLTCADCGGTVPLYRVSHAGKRGDFKHVRYWERRYHVLDDLWTASGVGEQFAYRQLSRHDSDLSTLARGICRRIEKSTGIPTYYYLYRWYTRSVASERKRTCPNCGKKWFVDPLRMLCHYEFRCDRCRLVSNIGYDVR